MSLAEQFKAWVAEQPPKQTINHFSYDTCACGAFALTLPEQEDGDRVMGWDVAYSIYKAYGDDAYNIIGNGGRRTDVSREVAMSNYGELSAWLQTLKAVA